MIDYTTGNLLDDTAEALVNTVNEVGVMGKGVALMFRDTFPSNTEAYEKACVDREVRVGKMFVTEVKDLVGPRWVINFPTKKHWRQPSKMEWIRDGLKDLVRVIKENRIQSIAIPPLGCGNGGLEWQQVRREIEAALSDVPSVRVTVYAPTSQYQNARKRAGVEKLTPARALTVELIRRYCVLGLGCTNLEVQKLVWFLQRSIERLGLQNPFGLEFSANKFGPYADGLRHLLNNLDGSYLHCEKRLADAGPLDMIEFDEGTKSRLGEYLRSSDEAAPFKEALEHTARIIDGFESPLGMELLATVDWLMTQGGCAATVESVRAGLAEWPGGGKVAVRRKQRLFDDRLLRLAVDRLASF
ncbi:MAG TPA: macro domain-containing protein [Planctomycetaceae bacterium]|jgi:O-acetyl-ADP-ribose deacetylase (regulator of RNase III)|nr:macro domain-containing protein [Planctomycetaceae bacterium]